MLQTVSVPVWLLVLILLFAAVTFASHFLFPSVRWFLRRRAEKLIARLNERLQKPIEPFKMARRYDMIQRLVYDPEVIEAASEYARDMGVREDVAVEKARDYAREIVPSFSAWLYFSFGARVARWLSRFLYNVRVGQFDRAEYEAIDRDATVIFVMNHRSNMDYVLVTYLVSRTSALSYAVGEWARVWPLSVLIRMLGAYFIRRKSRGALYRKVLARYVQMATNGGVTQAVFPEGGLSLTGALAEPRLGILNYIISDFDTDGARDVIFVPVALNYDRVLEDRFLIRADEAGKRKFRAPLIKIFGAVIGYLWKRARGRLTVFGTANVSFGKPLSMRAFAASQGGQTEDVADELIERIGHAVALLPVPLVARAVLDGAATLPEVTAHIERALIEAAADAPRPRRSAEQVAEDGLTILQRRRVVEDGARFAIKEGQAPVLSYYAASIAHHFGERRLPHARRNAEEIKLQK